MEFSNLTSYDLRRACDLIPGTYVVEVPRARFMLWCAAEYRLPENVL